jgi:hypothetical protein
MSKIGPEFKIGRNAKTAFPGYSHWLHQIAIQVPIFPFWHKPVDSPQGYRAKCTVGKVYLDAKGALLVG